MNHQLKLRTAYKTGGVTQEWLVEASSTDSPALAALSTVSTAALAVAVSTKSRHLLLIPPSTNTWQYQLNSSNGGVTLSSRGMSVVSVTPGSSYYLRTTAGTVSGMRVISR